MSSFKNGKQNDCNNYRGICLLNTVCTKCMQQISVNEGVRIGCSNHWLNNKMETSESWFKASQDRFEYAFIFWWLVCNSKQISALQQ